MSNKILYLLVFVSTVSDFCLSSDVPTVETPLGKIHGVWRTSNSGRKYASFEGIPYARPPVGELRFEDPVPIERWPEALNATQPRTCLQDVIFKLGRRQGEEDCLYLNVYIPTPAIDIDGNFDVLVHIHGGAFLMGSGHMMADPNLLMDKDFILVSMNYRLGILGFLSTGDEVIPGNYGMKDQVLALRWIKDNIASFRGNPDSVTISGLSAGGASVHFHYFSPLSKGLFIRGLSHSGTALCPWAVQRNPLEIAKKLAEILGCPDNPHIELKQCLKEKPSELFLQKTSHFSFDDISLNVPFAPVIENGSENPFLTSDPYSLLKDKKVLDLPWITSTTTDEGFLATAAHYSRLDEVDADWPEIAHHLLDYSVPESRRVEVANKIKDFYLGPGEHFNKDNFKKFSQIFTDRLFATAAEVAAKLQSRVNKSPVYYFLFNYKEAKDKAASVFGLNENVDGVGHGEDNCYFYSSAFSQVTSRKDKELRTACQNMLYLFTTAGKASVDGTDYWKPTGYSELTFLNITDPDNIKLQRTNELTPVKFWSTLGLVENEDFKQRDEL